MTRSSPTHSTISQDLQNALDKVLKETTGSGPTQAHGVVLGVTDRTKTVYLKASGHTNTTKDSPELKPDTKLGWYSCGKAVTTTALLALVTQGKIAMDEPITTYFPEFAQIKVEDNGTDVDPATPITLRHLLSHTAGFSYKPIINFTKRGGVAQSDPDVAVLEDSFLSFHPGTRAMYGISIDWAGFILERITGISLSEYIQKHIFDPLDIHGTTFDRDENEPGALKTLMRNKEGVLEPVNFHEAFSQYRDMGGHGLSGPVDDYLKFIRLWLNKGRAPDGTKVFDESLYEEAITNQLPEGIKLEMDGVVPPSFTEPFPDVIGSVDEWGLGFGVTTKDKVGGRPKGSLYWCGFVNVYYWIDVENGLGVFFGSQLLPFLDMTDWRRKIEQTIYSHWKPEQ